MLEWFILNVLCNVPGHVTVTYQIRTFWVHLQCTDPVRPALTWSVHSKCTCNIFTMYWAWEIKNTWWVHCEYIEEPWDIINVFRKYWIFAIYSQCTCYVFLISQAQYIVKMSQVHFEWTDQESAGRTGSVHCRWTQNVPIWYVTVTWPGTLQGTFRINHSSTF